MSNKLKYSPIPLSSLVTKAHGPFYAYDLYAMVQTIDKLRGAFKGNVSIHYAMKANFNVEILKKFKSCGIGVDVVSAGEIRHALSCGFVASDIIFSGVGKTIKDLELAISLGIKQINVESGPELLRIFELVKKMEKKTKIAFRLNPDVSVQTHPYIATGLMKDKFGIDFETLKSLLPLLDQNKEFVELQGLAMHIG